MIPFTYPTNVTEASKVFQRMDDITTYIVVVIWYGRSLYITNFFTNLFREKKLALRVLSNIS